MASKIEAEGRSRGYQTLRGIFLLFLVLYWVNLLVPLVGPFSHTARLWLISSVMIGLISLVVLCKAGVPEKSKILLGLFLALLAGLRQPFTGIITLLAWLASMRMMETTEERVFILKRSFGKSLLLGVSLGLVLGVVNLFLGGLPLKFAPTVDALVLAFNPGVAEEVIFRLFVYAFSLNLLGGRVVTRKETIWLYVLMVVPHVLLHFPDNYFVDGILTLDLGVLFIGPLLAGLLFGLPMTLAMVKRDLTSAMLIHTIVDYLRFIFIGLPF